MLGRHEYDVHTMTCQVPNQPNLRPHTQSYEKIRVVGKGAFGNAVLYRRRADGLMCIIKVSSYFQIQSYLLIPNKISFLNRRLTCWS